MIDPSDLANRFTYHPPVTDEQARTYVAVRNAAHDLAVYLNKVVPDGREKSLAITHLEETVMWANAGIARNRETTGTEESR